MGVGYLDVAPELIPSLSWYLPPRARIVGSEKASGVVRLLIENPAIEEGARLTLIISIDDLVRTCEIKAE